MKEEAELRKRKEEAKIKEMEEKRRREEEVFRISYFKIKTNSLWIWKQKLEAFLERTTAFDFYNAASLQWLYVC